MTITTLTTLTATLAELLSGQPGLLVLAGLPGAEELPAAVPELRCWQVSGLRIAPFGAAVGAETPLPALPAGVLAILAPSAAAAEPLLAAWRGIGPGVPPVLVAASVAAAWPALARLALAELTAAAQRTAGLHRALVATRQDYEETRTAMTVLMQSSGFRAPVGLETALASDPGPEAQAARTESGHLALGQVLNLSVESVAAVALHIAMAEVSAEARLRLRLYGAESGRVLAAWLVPAAALRPGWLALDLPAPIGPVRETACLDLVVEGATTDLLAVSLEDATAGPDRGAFRDSGAAMPVPLGHALALRLWQAPFGRRFAMPLYWHWEQGDLVLPPPAVPVAMAQQIWPLAQLPLGGSNVALGAEAPRPVLVLAPGAEAMAVLPQVPVAGLDLLEAGLALPEGGAEGLEVALWLQPAGCQAATPEELHLAAPGARCSGWRRLPADASDRLDLALRLPLGAEPTLAVVLVARLAASAPAACRLEWAELFGRALGRQDLPQPAPASRLVHKPRPAECAGVRMHEHHASADGGYRHLDMTLDQVRLGGTAWPVMRFKLALNGAAPQLEFRLRADWPVLFQQWPGDVVDQHGPVYLMPEDRLLAMLDGMRSARDAQAVRALVQLLPGVVRGLPREAGDPAPWLEAARRLAAVLEAG